MPPDTVSYRRFTPDRFLDCLDAEGETGLDSASQVYDDYVAPEFADYLTAMEAIPSYGGITRFFRDAGIGWEADYAPDFDTFILTAEEFLGARRGYDPGYRALDSALDRARGVPKKSTAPLEPPVTTMSVAASARVELFLRTELTRIEGVTVMLIDANRRQVNLLFDNRLFSGEFRAPPEGGYDFDLHTETAGEPAWIKAKIREGRLCESEFSADHGVVRREYFSRSGLRVETLHRIDGGIGYEIRHDTIRLDETILRDTDDNPFQFRLCDEHGRMFDPLKKQEELPDDAFVYLMTRALTTRAEFTAFEKTYLKENSQNDEAPLFPENIVVELRRHGRGLFGIDELSAGLERRYSAFGLKIESENPLAGYSLLHPHPDYQLNRIPVAQLRQVLEVLGPRLARYPDAYLAGSGIRMIRLFGPIWDGELKRALGGFASHGVATYTGSPATLDHELYHIADDIPDDSWGITAHGLDYELAFIKQSAGADGFQPGFVSSYAFTGNQDRPTEAAARVKEFGEDKAEVAEAILNDPAKANAKVVSDPHVAAKVGLMRDHFYTASGGRMDERFWRDVARAKTIDDRYWMSRRRNSEVKADYFGVAEFSAGDSADRRLEASRLEEEARSALFIGDFGRADAVYAYLTRAFPDDPFYPMRLGDLKWAAEIGKTGAVGAYAEAIRRGNRDPHVFKRLTLYWRFLGLGGYQRAMAEYANMVANGVRNPELHHELGRLYVETKDWRSLRRLYESRIDLCRVDGKGDPAYVYHYARFLSDFAAEIPDEYANPAWKFIVSYLDFDADPRAFYFVIDALLQKGWHGYAIPALEKARDKHPVDEFLADKLRRAEPGYDSGWRGARMTPL